MIGHEAVCKHCKLALDRSARNLREYQIDNGVADEQPLSIFRAERQGISVTTDVREAR